MYDLLLKGGDVLDPGRGLKGALDIAIRGNTISRIAAGIDPKEAQRVIQVDGKLVVPGLIDLHAHVAEGLTGNGINPDLAGVYAGVCTVVDAGSTGSHTVAGLARYVAPHARTRLFCLVHIARTGLATMPELRSREDIDLKATIAAIQTNRPFVQGVKLRLAGPGVRDMGVEAVRLAREAARETGTRLMVHIGDPEGVTPPEVTRQMLGLMGPGDIVTHFFTGNAGSVLDANGRVWPEVKEALARGVHLDTAHGRFNFSFDTARRVLDQGPIPHTISTDMTLPGRPAIIGSVTELMSKFLALGFSLEEVVRMTTANAARALGMEDRLGALAEGREADLTVLEAVDGSFVFRDTPGKTLKGAKALVPLLTIRAGQPMPLDWGPRPWGWLPERE
ncbi:MAG: amidohydrolase/deacetylase family metallohydrolase [Chloroflexi bacterium]|nr:amidohydrolase/deacetylase family metallohydrolase [Chloroflexota bacterium]